MSEFYIIVVEPKYGGNIGAVARSMMNFNFNNLILVKPCEFNYECYARAMHAKEILEQAKIVKNFDEAINKLDYLVATSAIDTKNEKPYLRNPILLNNFSEQMQEIDGKIGIVFGREDFGLLNEEIARCDIMVKIPTSEKYPSLNLSHAVNLVLYSLFNLQNLDEKETRKIGDLEREKLHEYFSTILNNINYPKHKKENTKVMFRRIMGRAIPSTWEYHALMGIFSKIIEKMNKK